MLAQALLMSRITQSFARAKIILLAVEPEKCKDLALCQGSKSKVRGAVLQAQGNVNATTDCHN
jgi:hypothetical protein